VIGGVAAIVAGVYGMRAIRIRDEMTSPVTSGTMAAAR
jgi:hypothetical protein